MTRRLVLDASAAIAIIRAEPEGDAVRRTIDGWKQAGGAVMVPDIFWLEVVNALVHRYRWTGADVLQAIHDLDSLDLAPSSLHRPLLLTSLDLVERFGLTAYDATYLALAMNTGAALLSLDDQLVDAAGDRALSLDDGHRLHEPPAVYEHDVTWPSYARASSYLAELRARARAEAPPATSAGYAGR
jgi:predicted nucleic acid-binding protein